MELPRRQDFPAKRSGDMSHRPRAAAVRVGAGLLAVMAVIAVMAVTTGCVEGPHPVPTADQQASAALVDSCRGVADGALCNDQNTCTVGDKCAAGLCIGTLAPDGTSCTDNNQCTATDLCIKGVCKGTPVPEGTLCTDGEPCTDPDVCHLGQCTSGGPATCDDGDGCTVDSCQEGEGCRHDRILTCSDAGMTGDGAAGGADGGGSPDAPGTDAPDTDADAGSTDVMMERPDDGPAADLPTEDGAAVDAVDDALDAADAPPDSGRDAGEDASVDGGTADIARIYEAKGGACVCSSAPGGPPSGTWLVVVLALTLLRARARRCGRPGDHPRVPGASTSRGRPKDR
jgi:MYXO-CTERM domain-containing protein